MLCDDLVDSCASQPCQHGGTCTKIRSPDGFECKCTEGREGARCEKGSNYGTFPYQNPLLWKTTLNLSTKQIFLCCHYYNTKPLYSCDCKRACLLTYLQSPCHKYLYPSSQAAPTWKFLCWTKLKILSPLRSGFGHYNLMVCLQFLPCVYVYVCVTLSC